MPGEYDELLGQLDSLRTDTRKRALRTSLRAMGRVMQAAIVQAAPEQVDDVHGVLPAGALKADIKVRVHVADDEDAGSDGDTVTIGPTRKTVDIAVDVETGHSNRPRNQASKRSRKDRTMEHPFVRPAFDATKDEAIAIFEQTMAEEIAKRMNA